MLRIRRVLEEKKLLNLIARSSRTRWMSSSTEVMSFGDGSHGALGLPTSLIGHGMDAYEPTPVTGLPSDITLVSAGHYHSLAVTSHGQLWAWGRNHEVQLGRGLLNTRDTWNEPKRVEGLDQVQVTAAFASGVVSAAIGDDGSLWVWGRSKRGQLGLGKGITEASVPSIVEALEGEKIAKGRTNSHVSFGWGHALALTVDGKLFGWGYLADGRLGKMGGLVEASPLDSMEELKGVEVVDIACGLDHSLVLCRDGTLLSSGSNIYGQLGRANHDIGLFPVDISFPAASIASGLGHSLAICRVKSSEGEGDATGIVSWGWNQSSQLGRPEPENVPMEVEGLAGETAILVSGGRAHSIAVTSKGEVWVWGCGRNGRLGLGSSCDEPEPVMLDSLEGCEVLQAVSGFDHNLILIAR
ncbi:REGULATOR OF CHROMOSOME CONDENSATION [Salix viminalis]|uniref:REGULATOR OF CHROMOSOME CONDENSATION n=1 Tax=Salix viminalis TaxID=40686 RepID=A0A9Q0NRA2_SALVM|nr:REGULATOR OF CHROMOSOME CONDENSATION [Salix viminalis]